MFTELRSSAHKRSTFNAPSPEIALPVYKIWAQTTQDPDLDHSFNGTADEAQLEKIANTLFFSLFSLSSLFSSSSTHTCTNTHIKLPGRLVKTNNCQYQCKKDTRQKIIILWQEYSAGWGSEYMMGGRERSTRKWKWKAKAKQNELIVFVYLFAEFFSTRPRKYELMCSF